MSAGKMGMPCAPCCAPSGIAACGCSGIPTTLSMTFTYPTEGTGGVVVQSNATAGLTYNPGTIVVYYTDGATYPLSVTGYWGSPCLPLPDKYGCASPCVLDTQQCSCKFVWFCGQVYNGPKWYLAQANELNCNTTCADMQSFSFNYNGWYSGTCNPYSWSFGTPGLAGYRIVTS